MMNRLILAVSLSFVLASGVTRAEEFLGVENASKEAPAKTKAAAARSTSATSSAPTSNDGSAGGWHFFGAVGGGVSGFSGALTLAYFFNKYASLDTTIDYVRLDRRAYSSEQYGPEVDLVIRGVNPTIFTPFVGAGPGYTLWIRHKDEEAYDKGQSPIASVFGGIGIRMTRHFGLSVQRRRTTYYRDPPKTFGSSELREPKSRITDHIGFAVMF